MIKTMTRIITPNELVLSKMNWQQLYTHWQRDKRRRWQQVPLFGHIPKTLFLCLICLGSALFVHRYYGNVVTARVWLIALGLVSTWLVLSGPDRMFWRKDGDHLCTLGLPAKAVTRALFADIGTSTISAISPFAVFAAIHTDLWNYSTCLLLVATVCICAILAPALTLLGGSITANIAWQTNIRSAAGGLEPPSGFWIGSLPAAGATLGILCVIGSAPAVIGYPSQWNLSPWLPALSIVVACGTLLWLIGHRSSQHFYSALRAVRSLDDLRYAHIETPGLSRYSKLFRSILSKESAFIFEKDSLLFGRRYPASTFVAFITMLILLVAAGVQHTLLCQITLPILCIQALQICRKKHIPPIEWLPFLLSLGVETYAIRRAKWVGSTAWYLAYPVFGSIIVWLRLPHIRLWSVGCLAVTMMGLYLYTWTRCKALGKNNVGSNQ